MTLNLMYRDDAFTCYKGSLDMSGLIKGSAACSVADLLEHSNDDDTRIEGFFRYVRRSVKVIWLAACGVECSVVCSQKLP